MTSSTYAPSIAESGLALNRRGSLAQIDGTFCVREAICPAALGCRNMITATGSIYATSGPYPRGGTVVGDVVINLGKIIASSDQDGPPLRPSTRSFRRLPKLKTHVTGLAGGVIVATSSQGNDLRLDAGDTGAVVFNHGTIQTVNAAAVDVSSLTLGTTGRLTNTGLIVATSTAFNGGGCGTFTILTSGPMIDDVLWGGGRRPL